MAAVNFEPPGILFNLFAFLFIHFPVFAYFIVMIIKEIDVLPDLLYFFFAMGTFHVDLL